MVGLIATIAILHVLINDGLAVGMMPLVAAMEWHAYREAAVTTHRKLVRAKTQDYMGKVEQARRQAEAQAPGATP